MKSEHGPEFRLRCLPMIVPEYPTEPLIALNLPGDLTYRFTGIDDLVFESKVIAFGVVVFEVLIDHPTRLPWIDKNHPAQAFFLN